MNQFVHSIVSPGLLRLHSYDCCHLPVTCESDLNYVWKIGVYFQLKHLIHSGTLKIAPQEGKKIQSRNFADKKKNMSYANDVSFVTMRMTVHPVVALQSGRERHINQR